LGIGGALPKGTLRTIELFNDRFTNFMSLMISQLDLVVLKSSKRAGIVTRKSLGFSLLIS